MHRLRAKRIRLNDEAEANPMDGLANLADAMLVLAVGIMLALILNWQLDISETGTVSGNGGGGFGGTPMSISAEDMADAGAQAVNEEDLIRIGALYYDEASGAYYAISEGESNPDETIPDNETRPNVE